MIMHTTSHFKSNFYQPNFYVGRTLYTAFNNILVCNYLNLQIKQKNIYLIVQDFLSFILESEIPII